MEQKNFVNKGIVLGVFLVGMLLINSTNASASGKSIDLDEYLISYNYDNAVAGEVLTLSVTVTNTDNENKTGVNLDIDENDPFDFISNNEWDIGELNVSQNVTKTFRIKVDDDADSETYELKFKLEDSKDDYKDEFKIKVLSDNVELEVANVQSNPTTILPNTKDVKLIVSIENKGDVNATDVKVKIKLPSGFSPSSSYSDTYTIGTIPAGAVKTAEFYVDTEKTLKADSYKAELEITYENDNEDKTTNLDVDLPVRGIPQFSISDVNTNPSKIMQGSSVVLKFNLKNIGDKDGKETSVKVLEKSDQPFDFDEKTNYIGTINSGSTGTAVIKFNVNKDAVPSTYLLDVQIRTLYNGEVLVSEETIPIKVEEYEMGAVDYLKIAGLLLVGIVIILIVISVLKKKKNNFHESNEVLKTKPKER